MLQQPHSNLKNHPSCIASLAQLLKIATSHITHRTSSQRKQNITTSLMETHQLSYLILGRLRVIGARVRGNGGAVPGEAGGREGEKFGDVPMWLNGRVHYQIIGGYFVHMYRIEIVSFCCLLKISLTAFTEGDSCVC